MSYWIIKWGSGSMLCDFRPRLATPQWYYERNRAFKFASAAEARAFWRDAKKKHELDQPISFVRIVSAKERRARAADLTRALEDIVAVEKHPWRCSYCKEYADVYSESCRECGKLGGYSGSHDRDLLGCYRTMHEIATAALKGTTELPGPGQKP